jgi:uncharacterized beta barrel domain-containing protein DUF5777
VQLVGRVKNRGRWKLAIANLVNRSRAITSACVMTGLAVANLAAAQPPSDVASQPDAAAQRMASTPEDEGALVPAEPDFVVVNLPTGLRLPLFKSNFRLTHRFAGNLRRGSFGDQAASLFGIDQGATIGFEYRFAVARHVQAAFYRSSFDRTIQLHGKYDAVRQRRSIPASLSAIVSVEGTDNFQEQYAPALGVTASRIIGTRVAAYLTPVYAFNTAASLEPIVHDDGHDTSHHGGTASGPRRDTTYLGIGGRVRVGGTTYVAGEIVPRVGGYRPDEASYGISVEKRVGGHVFSLTFTNSAGTTLAEVARGGSANTLHLGFNLGRKFF